MRDTGRGLIFFCRTVYTLVCHSSNSVYSLCVCVWVCHGRAPLFLLGRVERATHSTKDFEIYTGVMRTSARGRRSPPTRTGTAPGTAQRRHAHVPRRRDHHRMDAHRTQQVPQGPHAHQPWEHRFRRGSRGAVPSAQVCSGAELKPPPAGHRCVRDRGAESIATALDHSPQQVARGEADSPSYECRFTVHTSADSRGKAKGVIECCRCTLVKVTLLPDELDTPRRVWGGLPLSLSSVGSASGECVGREQSQREGSCLQLHAGWVFTGDQARVELHTKSKPGRNASTLRLSLK